WHRDARLWRNRWFPVLPLAAVGCGYLLTFLFGETGFWTMLVRHTLAASLAGGLAVQIAPRFLLRRTVGHSASREPQGCSRPASCHAAAQAVTAAYPLSPASLAACVLELNPAERLSAWLKSEANAMRVATLLTHRIPGLISAIQGSALQEGFRDLITNDV